MSQLQKEIIEQAEVLERLDHTLKIVTIRNWIILIFFLVLFFGSLFWSFTGTIPITVTGKALLIDTENVIRVRSLSEGTISKIMVKEGDKVKKGDVLAFMGGSSTITAKEAGTIVWISSISHKFVTPRDVLFWIQTPYSPKDLAVIGFFPLAEGERIQDGMNANVSLTPIDSKSLVFLQGKVKKVYQYPVGPNDRLLHKIPSVPLRKYLVEGKTPTIATMIQPLIDPDNPTGLQWTSDKGPTEKIEPGTIGMVRVTLRNKKPIAFLFPVFGESSE